MLGNNILILCNQEMELALEHYLNSCQFKEPISVHSIQLAISDDGTEMGFEIKFKEADKKGNENER